VDIFVIYNSIAKRNQNQRILNKMAC